MKLYIDPGTGAMLFAMMTGIIGLAGYFLKGLHVKLSFISSGGKKTGEDNQAIPLVVFSDDKRYWPVFEPICREMNSRGFDVTYMTASPDDPALHNAYEHIHAEFIGEGNKVFMRLNFLKAIILLSTTPGLDVYQWKRSKDVKYYIHIPHMPGELTTYRMFGVDFFDALMLSGQYQINDNRALEKLRGLPEKECILVGIPYLDEKAKRLKEIKTYGNNGKNEVITVLVAPSWGSNSLLNRFGNKLIDELIATGYHIIIRPHPQSFTSEKELIDRLMNEYPQLEWNRDTDNFEVLNRSDIMVSDFSGVIFDYSLVFDKPVICAYTDFDDSQDDAWWLDTPIWTATAIPRIGPILSDENLSQVRELIDRCLTDESFAESRQAVRQETWANRGDGARLAADYLMNKYQELTDEVVKMGKEDGVSDEIIRSSVLEDAIEGADEAIKDGLEPTNDSNKLLPESKERKHEKQQKRNRFIIIVSVISAMLLIAILGLQYALILNTEKQYEMADLQLMRAALSASQLEIENDKVDEKKEYWFNSKLLELLPADYDSPQGYGLGTSRVGGAADEFYKKYTDDGTHFFKYDEDQDYTDKIIKVIIDPKKQVVTLRWVPGSRAPEVSTEEESAD